MDPVRPCSITASWGFYKCSSRLLSTLPHLRHSSEPISKTHSLTSLAYISDQTSPDKADNWTYYSQFTTPRHRRDFSGCWYTSVKANSFGTSPCTEYTPLNPQTLYYSSHRVVLPTIFEHLPLALPRHRRVLFQQDMAGSAPFAAADRKWCVKSVRFDIEQYFTVGEFDPGNGDKAVKTYVCKLCQNTIKDRLADAKRHMTTHPDELGAVWGWCPFCRGDQSHFAQYSHYKNHFRAKHDASDAALLFSCNQCGERAKDRMQTTRHVQKCGAVARYRRETPPHNFLDAYFVAGKERSYGKPPDMLHENPNIPVGVTPNSNKRPANSEVIGVGLPAQKKQKRGSRKSRAEAEPPAPPAPPMEPAVIAPRPEPVVLPYQGDDSLQHALSGMWEDETQREAQEEALIDPRLRESHPPPPVTAAPSLDAATTSSNQNDQTGQEDWDSYFPTESYPTESYTQPPVTAAPTGNVTMPDDMNDHVGDQGVATQEEVAQFSDGWSPGYQPEEQQGPFRPGVDQDTMFPSYDSHNDSQPGERAMTEQELDELLAAISREQAENPDWQYYPGSF